MGVLIVDDPRAEPLARALAERSNLSVNEVVVQALKAQLPKGRGVQPRNAAERSAALEAVNRIQAEVRALTKPGGRDMTKAEIDTMWGHD